MPAGKFHIDQSGAKINMLTLLNRTGDKAKNGSWKYLTRCDCGTEKVIAYNQMSSGKAKSCGCLSKRKGEDSPNFKHGRSKTKDYYNELSMRQNYGLEYSEYLKMVENQENKCAICGANPPSTGHKKRLNIDHCHDTGKVRGLLCDLCNRALGLMRDNTDYLEKAIQYLNKYANAR